MLGQPWIPQSRRSDRWQDIISRSINHGHPWYLSNFSALGPCDSVCKRTAMAGSMSAAWRRNWKANLRMLSNGGSEVGDNAGAVLEPAAY